ncbi:MAG: SSS family solute:Na+ symporter [Rhodothermales bacterium]
MTTLDTSIIFIYMGLMVAIGLYANYRQQDVEDYYVAGRRLGPFSIACLWLASWIGGASIIGGSARAYDIGISSIFYVASLAVGCLLFGLFAAARVTKLGKEHGHLTYPDFIEQRFDSRTRIVATITTAAAFIAFAAGQMVAMGSILHVLIGWDYSQSLLLASVIVITYTATGGFLAVTYTDWVQFILLLIGILFIGLPIAIQEGGSYSDLQAVLPSGHFDIGAWGWPTIIALVFSIVLSFFVAMDSFTRCFAAKDPDSSRRGALLAVIFVLPIAVAATWMGLASAALFPAVENSNDILTIFVIEYFPTGFRGLVLVGILAAVMSTADICILTSSANLTRDIYQRYYNPQIEQKAMLRLSMWASVAAGLVATLMAWKMQDIIDILLLGFTINSAALFLPTMAGLLFKKSDPSAAFWSIALSLPTVILWKIANSFFFKGEFTFEPLWPGLAVSFATYFWIALSNRSRT